MRRGCRYALVACLFLAGCAVHDNPFYNYSRRAALDRLSATEPMQSLHHVHGLDIRFADRRDWLVYLQTADRFSAAKRMGSPNYSAALAAGLLQAPPKGSESGKEFLGVARRSREDDRTNEIQRLDFQAEPGAGNWSTCLKYYKKYTTQDNANAPGKLLLMEEAGYMCRHPTIPGVYLRIDYSERYQADLEITEFKNRSEKFLGYTEFAGY